MEKEEAEEKPPTNRSQPIFGRFWVPKIGFGFGFATVLPLFYRKLERFEYFCGIQGVSWWNQEETNVGF